MKTCTRCKQTKPDASFRVGKSQRINSHCWHCRREVRNESRRRYLNRVRADKMFESSSNDPVAHAYLIARHISDYVGNCIDRWERKKGIEAHPTLRAIRELADSLSDAALQETVEKRVRHRLRCELCGVAFEQTDPKQKFCCKVHAEKARSNKKIASGANAEKCRHYAARKREQRASAGQGADK